MTKNIITRLTFHRRRTVRVEHIDGHTRQDLGLEQAPESGVRPGLALAAIISQPFVRTGISR